MGKGDRRHKPRNVPGLAPVPRKVVEGNSTRRPRVRVPVDTGADIPALDVRARHNGYEIKPETTKDGRRNAANVKHNTEVRAEMRLTGYESGPTAAISIARQGEQRAALLGAWWGLTAAETRYHRIVLGKSCDAKTAKVEMQPERMETSAEHPPPDLRDEAARARDASNTWMHWRGLVMQLPNHLARSIVDAMHGEWELHRVEETREGKRDAILTARGRRFVEAVEALAKVVEGKHI